MAGDGDSLRRVKAGDRVQIPADAYNAMLAVVRERRAAAFDGGAGAVRIPNHPPATVLVRNDTGGDLDRFAVVALGAPAVAHADDATEFFRRPNLAGDAPEGGEAVFGVLLEPAADGVFGVAQVSGVCPVRVNVTDEAHTHASPVAGDTEMLGSDTAGVPVLWKESGTGTKWAYVLLGAPAAAVGGSALVRCDTAGYHNVNGYVQTYNSLTNAYTDSGSPVSVVFPNGRQADSTSTVYLATVVGGIYFVSDNLATETVAGEVSTAAQTFGGRKSFPDGTVSGNVAVVCSTDGNGVYGVVGGAYCVSAYRIAAENHDIALCGLLSGSNVLAHTDALSDGIYTDADYQMCVHFLRDLSGGGAAVGGENEHIKIDSANLWVYADKVWVSESGGGAQQCATGTLGDGSDVVNGLITSVGTTIDGGTW